mgnify:CR=1 FL=1
MTAASVAGVVRDASGAVWTWGGGGYGQLGDGGANVDRSSPVAVSGLGTGSGVVGGGDGDGAVLLRARLQLQDGGGGWQPLTDPGTVQITRLEVTPAFATVPLSMTAEIPGEPQLRKSHDEWRRLLTPEQYTVLFEEGTERSCTSPLNDEKRAGTYVCAGCGNPLFKSGEKFESGTGWPSFTKPIEEEAIAEVHEGTAEDADRAVEAAQRAFPAWRAVSPADRVRPFRLDAPLTTERLTLRAFTEHESHREPSVEFKQPGPSPWRHAQEWAQFAVDPAVPLPGPHG